MEVREVSEREQAAMDRLECARAAYNDFMDGLSVDVRAEARRAIILAVAVEKAEEEVNFESDH